MKSLMVLLFLGSQSLALAADQLSMSPSGEMTSETPSIESAYPGETYVQRTIDASNDTISYEVRFYAPEVTNTTGVSTLWEVALVVRDQKGSDLVSTRIDASSIGHIPPNKNAFRSFRFTIHKSLEPTMVVNIGRYAGLRMVFARYKLPMKSIDHPKAH